MGWILLVGFLVDILWVFFVRTVPFSDFLYYHELATQIAHGGIWGDTYTSVGYPIFLALFYKVFGSSLWVAKFLNVVLSTINNGLVYLLLKRFSLSDKLRKLILLLFVLFPMNVYYNSLVASEILFTTGFLLILTVYLANVRLKYVWIGVLAGLIAMIKPFFPVFALAVFLIEWVSEREFWVSLKKAGIVFFITFLVLTPWLYRNYQMFGQFSYISNNGGIVLYINNNSQNIYGGWMPAEDVENSLVKTPEYAAANTVERNKMLSTAAKEWIISHPADFVRLGLKRLMRTYLLYGDINFAFEGVAWIASSLPVFPVTPASILKTSEWVRAPLFFLGCLGVLSYSWLVLGALFSPRRLNRMPNNPTRNFISIEKEKLTLLITFYMFAGVYFITEGQSRYAFPTIFILIYFAFWRVYRWVDRWRQRKNKE